MKFISSKYAWNKSYFMRREPSAKYMNSKIKKTKSWQQHATEYIVVYHFIFICLLCVSINTQIQTPIQYYHFIYIFRVKSFPFHFLMNYSCAYFVFKTIFLLSARYPPLSTHTKYENIIIVCVLSFVNWPIIMYFIRRLSLRIIFPLWTNEVKHRKKYNIRDAWIIYDIRTHWASWLFRLFPLNICICFIPFTIS